MTNPFSATETPLIELDGVTRLYGTVIGVNDFNMTLPKGAYGLLGPNGAGKSTLLNLLIGQLRPSRGTVRVLGEDPRNNMKFLRRVGYCPGFEGLYSTTTGFDWVVLLLQMQGFSRSAARVRAADCMELVGMQEGMNRPISAYSRGMRQRTKLAQALAHDPELLVLDEPFSGLDPVGRSQMTDVLRDWIAEGNSLIIASHVLHEIEALTDSFLLICGGRLLASGTAAEVNELLHDTPLDIEIDCNDPHTLAGVLMQRQLAKGVEITTVQRVTGAHSTLRLQTASAVQLSAELPGIVCEHNLTVQRMESSDNSLQSLFNSLMKIHRGEV